MNKGQSLKIVMSSRCHSLLWIKFASSAIAYVSVRRTSSRKRGGSHLPYASIDDLRRFGRICCCTPRRSTYNARTEYPSHGPERRKQIAHRVAWAAVERNIEIRRPLDFTPNQMSRRLRPDQQGRYRRSIDLDQHQPFGTMSLNYRGGETMIGIGITFGAVMNGNEAVAGL
jgi:hypothetical protein